MPSHDKFFLRMLIGASFYRMIWFLREFLLKWIRPENELRYEISSHAKPSFQSFLSQSLILLCFEPVELSGVLFQIRDTSLQWIMGTIFFNLVFWVFWGNRPFEMDISYVEYVITPWIGWDCMTRILKKQIRILVRTSHHVTRPRIHDFVDALFCSKI